MPRTQGSRSYPTFILLDADPDQPEASGLDRQRHLPAGTAVQRVRATPRPTVVVVQAVKIQLLDEVLYLPGDPVAAGLAFRTTWNLHGPWKPAGGRLGVVMNNSDQDTLATVRLNLEALGLSPAMVEAADAYRAATVKIEWQSDEAIRARDRRQEYREFPGTEVKVPVKDGDPLANPACGV